MNSPKQFRKKRSSCKCFPCQTFYSRSVTSGKCRKDLCWKQSSENCLQMPHHITAHTRLSDSLIKEVSSSVPVFLFANGWDLKRSSLSLWRIERARERERERGNERVSNESMSERKTEREREIKPAWYTRAWGWISCHGGAMPASFLPKFLHYPSNTLWRRSTGTLCSSSESASLCGLELQGEVHSGEHR